MPPSIKGWEWSFFCMGATDNITNSDHFHPWPDHACEQYPYPGQTLTWLVNYACDGHGDPLTSPVEHGDNPQQSCLPPYKQSATLIIFSAPTVRVNPSVRYLVIIEGPSLDQQPFITLTPQVLPATLFNQKPWSLPKAEWPSGLRRQI